MSSFADRLAAAVRARGSQVCLGLDPNPAKFWGSTDAVASADPAASAAVAVGGWCRSLIDRAGPACVAVKPQFACFERLGAPGWRALAETVEAAHSAGLLVVADGKRGDVPISAAAYGQALVGSTPTPWGEVRGLGADAFTANPLLGSDALDTFVEAAAGEGASAFAPIRPPNQNAANVLCLPTPEHPPP
ncbi:MAG: orotidine-5'-phosphate decarboxylase, partial [Solirubrobacterales bacterium]